VRERRVGVRHQDLGGVAAAAGHGGLAVAGEIERVHRARPAAQLVRHARGRMLAQAVQEQQLGAGAGLELVQRERHAIVSEPGEPHR